MAWTGIFLALLEPKWAHNFIQGQHGERAGLFTKLLLLRTYASLRSPCLTPWPTHSPPSHPFIPLPHIRFGWSGSGQRNSYVTYLLKYFNGFSFPAAYFYPLIIFPVAEHHKTVGKIIFRSFYQKMTCHLPSQDTGKCNTLSQVQCTKPHSPYLCSFPIGLPDKTQGAQLNLNLRETKIFLVCFFNY